MARLAVVSSLLENVTVYRLWQATHAAQKLVPLRRHNDLGAARRVLDVGCGPGINTSLFEHADYVGLDWNEEYIAFARRRYGREFVATDIRTYEPDQNQKFDFIFVNSFFHHIDTPGTRTILRRLHDLLSPDGHIHVVDLVLPDRPSPARVLARWDRGEFPRPLELWRELFTEVFEAVVFEPFPIRLLGVTCWSKVYFKGRRKA
jgi:SAM-dependent methyltransferase